MERSVDQVYRAQGQNADVVSAVKESFARFHGLTRRESHVLGEIIAGASNKEAGRRLGISFRTIEVHRANLMRKVGARNTADLLIILFNWPPLRSAGDRKRDGVMGMHDPSNSRSAILDADRRGAR